MTRGLQQGPGFWRTLWLLLRSARKRSAGRRKRQQELLSNRSRGRGTNWNALAFLGAVVLMAVINGGAAFFVDVAVLTGQRLAAEQRGKIVVGRGFLESAREATEGPPELFDSYLRQTIPSEAKELAEKYGGKPAEIAKKLETALRQHGTRDLIVRGQAEPGLSALGRTGRLPAMLGSVALLWWALMLVFQGEGLELDLQRRRHPMWEWLFSHPVPAGAVFLAEMLSPIAANPMYWGGPLFTIVLYWFVYDPGLALLAGVLAGIPITLAAACLGKALEIGVILRFSPRTRGAIIGLMGWLGYASMMMFLLGLAVIDKLVGALAGVLTPLALLPWPWLRLFLGGQADGTYSFTAGVLSCELAAAVIIAGAVAGGVGRATGPERQFCGCGRGPCAAKGGRNAVYQRPALSQGISVVHAGSQRDCADDSDSADHRQRADF